MALTDNATNGRILKEAYGKGKLTLTADCEVGDLLTKDGALADASAATTMADWVALDKALSGVEIEVAKVATIGGLTLAALGDLVYLSNTAGGYGSAAGTVEQVVGQALSATDILVMPKWTFMESGNIKVPDLMLLGIGTGNTARFSWDTTDANGNKLLLQMPAGGSVDVPVLVIGQLIEAIDLALYNGVVDPRIAMIGVGAVATGPGVDFRKARGTAAAPTVVTSGDDLGTIRAYGAVAAAEWVQAAEIRFDMAGTIATTRGPGTITFLTATDAAPSVLTQAMIISAAQLVTVAAGLTLTTGNLTVASGGATFTNASLDAVAGRVAKFSGTVAAPNHGDGYGAVEIDITSSGSVAGTTAASSTWLNFAAASVPGANMICVQNNGIYLPTGITASSAKMIMGMRMQYVADDGANPGSLFLFSTNIFSNVLTALLDVNAIVDLGGSTGAQTGNDYKIPLLKDASAGVTWYVNVYHS